MKRILLKIRNGFSSVFFDPLPMLYKWRAIPDFFKNLILYQQLNKGKAFKIRFSDIFFVTHDKYMPAGTMGGYYFFQDIWAAEKIYVKKTTLHVDVASRIDGFVAHLLPFCKVEYVDIRKLESGLDNLVFVQGSITHLPYADNSVESLSCLHVIEHIGLGRYGDPIDPEGHIKAAKELARVLAPGGTLYLGTPVGIEKICFDAHRIFAVESVLSLFQGLEIDEFSLIDDTGKSISKNARYEEANKCHYACGLFLFRKPLTDQVD